MSTLHLTSTQQAVLDYCIFNYGGSCVREGDLLRIFVDKDEFYINVTDCRRFGRYTIYHRNTNRHTDGVKRFHTQARVKHLTYAFFLCFTHAFNKKYKIFNQPADYDRFEKDALKYKDLF